MLRIHATDWTLLCANSDEKITCINKNYIKTRKPRWSKNDFKFWFRINSNRKITVEKETKAKDL